jgi:hypothetical protein
MKRLCVALVWVSLSAGLVLADLASNRVYDAYFLGFETDPAMDYGGRDITTVHSAITRGIGWATRADRIRFVAPVYEFVFAGGLSVVQHEVFGHGSRAREFDLDPDYGFGLDFSGWTSVGKDPASNEQNIMLAAGGTEADSVLAHRILRDLYTGDGTDGSKIPLMLLTKVDFSLYCLITPDPADSPDDFSEEYNNGNDIAYYLVSRQAQQRNANPGAVWNNEYSIDFDDPQLRDNYDELRQAAIWNLVDPAALAALYGYAADHVIRGKTQVRPPVIPLGGDFGLTAGTRAFIGPDEITRFLDFYWITPGPLVTAYGRDLANPIERTYGWGGGIYRIPVVSGLSFGLAGDIWQVPESAQGLYDGSGWNAVGELDALVFEHCGLSFKVGSKSEGFFPGTPMASGFYGGAGVLISF